MFLFQLSYYGPLSGHKFMLLECPAPFDSLVRWCFMVQIVSASLSLSTLPGSRIKNLILQYLTLHKYCLMSLNTVCCCCTTSTDVVGQSCFALIYTIAILITKWESVRLSELPEFWVWQTCDLALATDDGVQGIYKRDFIT